MKKELFTCPLCGNRFDPSAHEACATCILHGKCKLVCCPVCGYSTVDPSSSRWAQGIASLLGKKDNEKKET
jgi:hypothetical protein